jgi:hypothetical protein
MRELQRAVKQYRKRLQDWEEEGEQIREERLRR